MINKPEFNPAWPKTWQKAYATDCRELWGATDVENFGYKNRLNLTRKVLEEYLPRQARVLDLAGAQGNLGIMASRLGYTVTWNDLTDDLYEYVILKAGTGNITKLTGNIFTLPETTKFDCIIAGEIIEHLAHPDQLLPKLKKLLAKNGIIILTTPNGEYLRYRGRYPRFSKYKNPEIFENRQFQPDGDGHIFLLTKKELKTFAEQAELETIKSIQFNNPLSVGHFKTRFLTRYLSIRFIEFGEKFSPLYPFAQFVNSHLLIILKNK